MERLGEGGTRTDSAETRYGDAKPDHVIAALGARGLALVDGLATRSELLRLTRSIATVVPHRDSDPEGVTTLTDVGEVPSGFAGFSAVALNPHTDCSGQAGPPALLTMHCSKAAVSGGQCVLIDGQAVHDDLAKSEPEALRAFRTQRSVLFGGASGHLGSILANEGGGRLILRFRRDELARFSPDVTRWLPVLHAAIERHAVEFDLAVGQGYVLDNHRWLHGRRAFTGQRVVHRVHGNPLPELGIVTGLRSSIAMDVT